MRLHLSWGASYVESSAAHRPNVSWVLITNAYLFKRFVIFCWWRDTKSMVCPSRATETVDLVSLRHTWALCLVSMWQLLSQRVKSLLQTICVRVHMWGFNSRHGTYICHVCLLVVFLSLTHASVNAVVLEHTDISIFLQSILGVL